MRLTKSVEASQRAIPDKNQERAKTQLQQRLLDAEAELNTVARNLARADD
jgi:hypothetical protein